MLDNQYSSKSAYLYFRNLLREYTGINLGDGKEYLVQARLAKVWRQLNLNSLKDLAQYLQSQPFGEEHRRILGILATRETFFFRDFYPFEALRQKILLDFNKNSHIHKPLQIWSAGCSSGQEPYSLALLLKEHFPHLFSQTKILATDFAPQALEKARLGRYHQWEINRGLPATYLVKYFSQEGKFWEVSPSIRKIIDFDFLNLKKKFTTRVNKQDIVFLRYVLIYFPEPLRKEILYRISQILHPGGYLFLGPGEACRRPGKEWKMIHWQKTSYFQYCP